MNAETYQGGWKAWRGTMRLSLFGPGMLVAACMLLAPAAHAFTMENKDAEGQYTIPKFDLEEQAKGFRKDGTAAPGNGKALYETPLGNGTLQFGVTPGSAFNSGSVFAPGLGPPDGLRASRQDFNRMLAPPSSLEYTAPR
jgi:hypothetical protein